MVSFYFSVHLMLGEYFVLTSVDMFTFQSVLCYFDYILFEFFDFLTSLVSVALLHITIYSLL